MYAVKCPDGTVAYVYKNIDHVFPLIFKDTKSAGSAAIDGLNKVKGKLDGKYESQIKQILFRVDEKNGSLQAHLRAAYVLYAAAPCIKLNYLEAAIKEVRSDESALRKAEFLIKQLVALLKDPQSNSVTALISEHIAKIVLALNPPGAALIEQMQQVRPNTDAWKSQ
jgi:hypothetical protein